MSEQLEIPLNLSQTERILKALRAGRSLTAIEGLDEFGCFRLAARIEELRKEGWPIETTMVVRNGKRYARYALTGGTP